MNNGNQKRLLSAIAAIVLGILLIIAGASYLITGESIPGLMPLTSAFLMVLLISMNRKHKDWGIWYAILFLTAAVLNLIAAVMQIMNSL